eukprot:scaffold42951_cov153-Amphora_coffeaeformis.AAC.1
MYISVDSRIQTGFDGRVFFVIIVVIIIFVIRNVAISGSIFPTHHATIAWQSPECLMQNGKVRLRVQDDAAIDGVQYHGNGNVQRQKRMTDQKGVKESFDQSGISDFMGKPGNDPRQTKERLHFGRVQLIVHGWIQHGQHGKDRES